MAWQCLSLQLVGGSTLFLPTSSPAWPAALQGLMGMMSAMAAMRMHAAVPFLHLTAISPHVTASLPPPTHRALAGAFTAQRQPGGLAAGLGGVRPSSLPAHLPAESACARGVSSFAFQGTNAHVLLAQPASAGMADLGSAASGGRVGGGASASSSSSWPLWEREYAHVLPPAHALLMRARAAAAATRAGSSQLLQLEADLTHAATAFLRDHVVNGKIIFPGAGYMEMALAAVHIARHGSMQGAAGGKPGDTGVPAGTIALADLQISAPLLLPADASGAVSTRLYVQLDVATGALCVLSKTVGGSGKPRKPTTHLSAMVANVFAVVQSLPDPTSPSPASDGAETQRGRPLTLEAMRAANPAPLPHAALYKDLASAGLQYGPAFRLVRNVHCGRAAALSALQAPAGDCSGFILHPATLDCALQLGAAVGAGSSSESSSSRQTYVPVRLEMLCVGLAAGHADVPATAGLAAATAASAGEGMWASAFDAAARYSQAAGPPASLYRDICLHAPGASTGACVHLFGLESKAVGGPSQAAAAGVAASTSAMGTAHLGQQQPQPDEDMLYEVHWMAHGSPDPPEPTASAQAAGPAHSLKLMHGSGSSSGSSAAAMAASSAALQALQVLALGSGAGLPGIALSTAPPSAHVSCGTAPTVAGDSAAALSGMVRTLAQELPALAWRSGAQDALAAAPAGWTPGSSAQLQVALAGAGPGIMVDGYGTRSAGAAGFVPRLVRFKLRGICLGANK